MRLAHITAIVQSTETEAWSLCMPLFNQLIHNRLLEWSISATLAE